MLDDLTRTVLQQTARRLSRSFLQYIDDAVPWTTDDKESSVELIHKIATEERDGIARLLTFLQRHHARPGYLGSFPASFTSANFVTLDYLRPLLAKNAQAEVEQLEKALSQVNDPEVRQLLKDLLALKSRHAKELNELTSTTQAHAPAIATAH
jgi:rubrerythrin